MRVFLGMWEYPTHYNIIRTQGKNSVQVVKITAEEKREQGKRKLSPSWQGSSTSQLLP